MSRLSCCRNEIKPCAAANVFDRRKQAASAIECGWETGWRCFFFIVRKSRCGVRSRLAERCKIIRVFGCEWGFTVALSIESLTLMIKRTLQDRESMSRSECLIAVMPDTFFCQRI